MVQRVRALFTIAPLQSTAFGHGRAATNPNDLWSAIDLLVVWTLAIPLVKVQIRTRDDQIFSSGAMLQTCARTKKIGVAVQDPRRKQDGALSSSSLAMAHYYRRRRPLASSMRIIVGLLAGDKDVVTSITASSDNSTS
jgi:hypothetical protein